MARPYQVGDTVILTRAVSVNHFRSVGMSITGKIVEVRTGGYRDRNYGITFDDRAGRWWYAAWEFRRVK